MVTRSLNHRLILIICCCEVVFDRTVHPGELLVNPGHTVFVMVFPFALQLSVLLNKIKYTGNRLALNLCKNNKHFLPTPLRTSSVYFTAPNDQLIVPLQGIITVNIINYKSIYCTCTKGLLCVSVSPGQCIDEYQRECSAN